MTTTKWFVTCFLLLGGGFWTRGVWGYHVANLPISKHTQPPLSPPNEQEQHVQIFERIDEGTNATRRKTLLMKPPPRRPLLLHDQSSVASNDNNTSAQTVTNSPHPTMSPTQPPTGPTTSTTMSQRWFGTDQLNHLKESVHIIDVVEAYNLDQFTRKSGDRATALCPFHDDHNPSLSVDANRGLYKCFACGHGGDVFHFVQSMEKLRGHDLTFYDAVRKVQVEFSDGTFVENLGSSRTTTTPLALTKEQREQQERVQDRICQMNAASAAFYSQALTWPMAGGARAYLSARHITPFTTRTFALGFAPDVYFGSQSVGVWGAGSLVEHLRHLGFTPDELLSSGLVIQTKRAEKRKQSTYDASETGESTTHDSESTEEFDTLSFDGLMDRFRGRIVVPIFDSTGKKILGFGGRILDESQQTEKYEQPKYLNSPESPVFHKKNILFGLHLTREESKASPAIIMVEGYMDAIALHSVGVTGVVATMGTAVSPEQLLAAAQAAYRREGPLILCFDSDDAGIAAVERLCANGMISDVLEKRPVDIRVASLLEGNKDPADFVEAKLKIGTKSETVASDFLSSTINQAVPWVDWYTQRILSSYTPTAEPGEEGSMRIMIDRLAEFMNICCDQNDRERKASEMAASLTNLISESTNATNVSDTVRNQLESDLLQRAASKGLAKEAAKRGGMDYDMDVGIGPRNNRLTAALARGHGPTSADKREKVSFEKLSEILRNENELPATLRSTRVLEKNSQNPSKMERKPQFRVKRRSSEQATPVLTPHFSGFVIDNELDAAWLGLNKRGANLVMGLPKDESRFIPEDDLYPRTNTPVYFNSNPYHGQQFITEEAVRAGYSNEGIIREPSIAYKGVAFLVKPQVEKMHSSTEDELLILLVRSGPARVSVKNWLDSRRAVHSEIDLHWTSMAKEWLFSCLVENMLEIPSEMAEPSLLRSYLASRDDTPEGAFSVIVNGDQSRADVPASIGILDKFFMEPLGEDSPKLDSKNSDATAQELLSTLVYASTAHHAQLIKAELDATIHTMERLPPVQNTTEANANSTALTTASLTLQRSQLESKCMQLSQSYGEIQRSLCSLAESANRVRRRVLRDNSAGWGVQRLTKERREKFIEDLEEFALNFVPPVLSSEMENLMNPDDPDEYEPYEDTLMRIDDEWINWLDDDGGAESEPTILPPIITEYHMDTDVEESLDDFNARKDKEWAGWLDD